MTDDDILDQWHAAVCAHKESPPARYGHTLFAKLAAEAQAVARFGRGPHRDAFRARFPGEQPWTSVVLETPNRTTR